MINQQPISTRIRRGSAQPRSYDTAEAAAFPRDHADWLREFAARHGRPPAVLHIGNLANNAYVLSGALNAAGLASDVLFPNAYHIMGCPEWEDADFAGDIGDPFLPAWDNVDLRGFQRPRWFAQGPTGACLRYLLARRSGDERRAERRWRQLESQRSRHCAALRRCQNSGVAPFWRWSYKAGQFSERAVNFAKYKLRRIWPRQHCSPGYAERVHDLIARFGMLFPERPDVLTPRDMPISAAMFDLWRLALEHYDLIVGYSTDGIYPLMVDRPYFTFEHGTIRSIPFEATAEGRLCALTYRMARHVFISNQDNIAAARRLGIAPFSFLPHPLSEVEVPEAEATRLRDELRAKLGADFLLFHPSRHHWSNERVANWEKANDVLIEGFARFVREDCPRAGAVFVNWGQTVAQSRALLTRLGIAERVHWCEPVGGRRLLAFIQATDVLADQFQLPGLSGTSPKGMRLGRPTMMYVDEDLLRWCLPEPPPTINARTPEQIHAGLRRLHRDPDYARSFAVDGPRWYRKYHSLNLVIDRFLTEMRKVVAP